MRKIPRRRLSKYVERMDLNMKRKVAKTLALLLALCMLLPQTALAATTYYIDVSITGPDAMGVERTVSGTSSRYGTLNTPLATEVVMIINDKYGELESVFAGTGLREIVDTGARAFQSGEAAWNSYVEQYYDSVDNAFKDTLKSTASTFADLTVNQANQVRYTNSGRRYTVTVTLKAYTVGSGDSSESAPSKTDTYDVAVESSVNGTPQVDQKAASQGETVTIKEVTPEDGYILGDLTVKDAKGNDVPVTRQPDGTYAFIMPGSNVSIEAAMVADPDMTGVSVLLNTDQNIAYMQGKADGNFYPASPITRGHVAQIFYRLLKNRDVETKSTFADVPDSLWCADAVNTLASLGIVNGITSETFAPNQPITRAQFVAICSRFTQISAKGETFTDVPAGYWAHDAVSTASAYGWVNGVGNGLFAPNQLITRAQAAAIMNRLLGRNMAGETYGEARQYLDVSQTYWAWKNICEASDGVVFQ